MVPRKVFGSAGGTIGRLPTNDWVLPDPLVSGRHARIRCEGGTFLIEDTSTNGVFINSLDNPLARGVPHALANGECIVIDPYRISVSVAVADCGADPFRSPSEAHPIARSTVGSVLPPLDSHAPDELDPLQALNLVPSGSSSSRLPASNRHAADLAGQSPLSDHYGPPSVRAEAGRSPIADVIPDTYDPLRNDSVIVAESVSPRRTHPPAPMPPASRPTESEGGAGERLAASPFATLLDAIGVAGVPADIEVARTVASILQIAVGGVMDLLQARQRIKDEFRMHMTTFAPRENNPLKFSANVADALENLLVRRNPAFLPPAEAFDEAFDDIRDHQVAMLAGMRTAFDSMLSEFDPVHLQREFDRASRTAALIPAPARLRYWELYRERVGRYQKDPEAGFRELFGDQFTRAYDAQLVQLKADRRRSHERAMP